MPELPEVETIRIGLTQLLPGKKVVGVKHDWPKSFPNSPTDVKAFLIGAKILDVRRRAKVLIIDLSTNYSLLIHLKMTGQLVFMKKDKDIAKPTAFKSQVKNFRDTERFAGGHPTTSLVGPLPDKSTRVIFDLGDSLLFFNDQRKFGWARLLPTVELEQIDFFKKIGPEPLAADFTASQFVDRIRRRPNSTIKAALLDQSVIAGVGNIYADESLWAARIHPATRVNELSTLQLKKLFAELQAILLLSIEKGGSTDRNYVDAEGKRGSYLGFAHVFRREGQPCHRHPATLIEKIRVAGRGTHVCPKCQIDK